MHLYLLLGVPLGSGSLLLNSPSLLDAERSHGPNLWPLKYNSWPQRGPTKPNQSQRTSTADHKKQHQQRAILTLNSDCIRGWETPSGDTFNVQSRALYVHHEFTVRRRSSLRSWRLSLSRSISPLLTRPSPDTHFILWERVWPALWRSWCLADKWASQERAVPECWTTLRVSGLLFTLNGVLAQA